MRLTPRAGRDEIVGVGVEGELLVKVRAAAADGAANAAMLRTVAAAAGVAPSRLQLVRGATSRIKHISMEGATAELIERLWPGVAVRMR